MRTEWILVINMARVRSYFERLENPPPRVGLYIRVDKASSPTSLAFRYMNREGKKETVRKTLTRSHIDLSIRRSCRKRPRERVTDRIDEKFISSNDFPSRFNLIFASFLLSFSWIIKSPRDIKLINLNVSAFRKIRRFAARFLHIHVYWWNFSSHNKTVSRSLSNTSGIIQFKSFVYSKTRQFISSCYAIFILY